MSTIGNSSPAKSPNASTLPPASIPPPSVGEVQFGTLRRLQPISSVFGVDRGQCIDRHYIERFLANHTRDIRGRVLKIAHNNALIISEVIASLTATYCTLWRATTKPH